MAKNSSMAGEYRAEIERLRIQIDNYQRMIGELNSRAGRIAEEQRNLSAVNNSERIYDCTCSGTWKGATNYQMQNFQEDMTSKVSDRISSVDSLLGDINRAVRRLQDLIDDRRRAMSRLQSMI